MFFRFPPRRIIGCFIVVNLFIVLGFMLVSWWNSPPDYIFKHPYFFFDVDIEEPRNLDQTCVLPRIHPFHPAIWSYLKFPKNIICAKRQPDFTYINSDGYLLFNESELLDTGYEVGKSLFCHWSPVLRTPSDGDNKVSFGTEVPLPAEGSKLPLTTESIRVQCENFVGFLKYEKILVHCPVAKTNSSSSPKNHFNILIFGIDSLSRQSFIRHLPRTYRYLTEELKMTVLRGMNKVGDNSYPNLIAILTGHKGYGDGLGDTTGYFDHWPLIWKNFSNAGFGTLWSEDMWAYGLFNYFAKGFHQPPTDYYMRPYWLALENTSLLKHSSYMCYGSDPKYFLQNDYLRRFIETYEKASKPYFAFSFLSELTHDYTSHIASSDIHFENYFISLNKNGYLNKTFMIVMSDHGHRFDSIRKTEIGHMEESLPFFSVYIPQSLLMLQPTAKKVLQQNSGRLISHFDTHATLMDLFHFLVFNQSLGQRYPESERRGQTLFREVPANRTCEDASIPVEYCSCQIHTPISLSDPRVKIAAETALWTINEMVKDGAEGLCAERTLQSINAAHLVAVTDKEESGDAVRVIIETEPNGVFEALILVQSGASTVLGDISRISSYTTQGDCIKQKMLRKFCYCTSLLDKKLS